MDVIIGEIPGGSNDAFLLIEEQGVKYPDGKLPVFKLASVDRDYWTGGVPAHAVNQQI